MNNSGMVNMTAVPTLVDLGNSVIGFLAFEGFKRYIISGKDNN